ncbi:hypothetical protein GCM10011494_10240 [Novosphingobium endophyticum]|uniref:PIN domain-containing protein n=1 Tax=Novosphingobium endophyticum TaxID=1955250 RepID=A0A916TQV6_9SPHN|nr:type II toxin-antitoxin system VapC family toxin [Novosphingobium endophyticum]GGB93752.1 hypothetical protein GCM10011494_10240 [Novosphingobium endophyticum]
MIVIDASVAVKWYANEALSEDADDIFTANQSAIIVPDIFVTEVMSALVRRANIDKAVRSETEASIGNLADLFAAGMLHAHRIEPPQMSQAAGLAMDLGHPLKDCIYLALAMERECPLITADAKFAAKAREVWEAVQTLGA